MRKILLIMSLILFISIAGVSAEDLNQDISLVQSPDGGTFAELQDKINTADEGSAIKLENNYTYEDSFKDGYITISKNITLDGDGYTIDAKSASGIFNITASGVVLNNIAFINAVVDDDIGSAILSNGDLSINNCRFVNSFAPIYSKGNLTVINSTFNGNINDYTGGGAICSVGTLTVEGCDFIGNTAEGNGGAIYSRGNLTVKTSTFSGNFAEGGGTIFSDGSAIVTDSNFAGNAAHTSGGGAIRAKGDLTVNSSRFIDNDASDWDYLGNIGGAIYASGPLNVTHSSFINNTGGDIHGNANNAIYGYAAYVDITYSTFVNNNVILDKFSPAFDLILNSTTIPSGEGVMISAIFNDKNLSGNLTIRINDDEKEVEIVNGSAHLKVLNLTPGTYDVDATYPEGEYWWEYSQDARFNVYSGSYVIEAPHLVKYYGGEERFAVNISEINGKAVSGEKVIIIINGEEYSRTTNDDGYASVAVNLNSGKYNVTVKCGDSEIPSSVTVKSTVSGKNITKTFRNATQYYAEFLDTEGYLLTNSMVRFNINGVFYDRLTNDDGVAKLNINLNPGEYIITAINLNSGEMYSNVVTVLSNIAENHNLTKYYRNDSQYVVRLLDDEGNPVGAGVNVTFNINGVLYTRTTNATGHAKLNINLEPGTYIITAIYKDLMTSNTITVLPVLEAKDLEMKYLDGSKFEAKLVDGEGNPYSGQNITFNVNGVFYDRTTDDSGIARLNINLMPGEYIITSSYNGSNIANRITISS